MDPPDAPDPPDPPARITKLLGLPSMPSMAERAAAATSAATSAAAAAASAATAAGRDALATLVPVDCPACGAPGIGLCERCRAVLRAAVQPRVEQLALGDGRVVMLASAASYDGIVRELIGALKERGRTDAVAPLARLLRVGLLLARATGPPPSEWLRPVLVPAPSRPASTRARGFVPIELVCVSALPRASIVPALRMRAATRDQAGLGREARATNMRGAIAASVPLSGAHTVLVDDVVTTGATAVEAVRALQAGGAHVPFAVSLARTMRRVEGAREGP